MDCESWTVTKNHLDKLAVFHMRLVNWILGINWSDVIDNNSANHKIETALIMLATKNP